ncbi:MAG: 30S ribosomal protein S12 methylthiotransferase RimO [Syntrophobacterales bacterium]|jgi:ribosomal protein S12 methylthiotransferase|nr:30S ribosomal protein S12 methylthiotransferase RimO [Syntrophobacterales bacterium]
MIRKKVYILSLGCPKNLIDAEIMSAALQTAGFDITPKEEEAAIIMVNTCAFILPAKEESIDEILRLVQWKTRGSCARLIVTGCLAQRYGQELCREIPEVDLFLGINEAGHIAGHVQRLLREPPALPGRAVISPPTFLMTAHHKRRLATPFYSAYLKIAEGCSNRCSYCVIPSVRGALRSRLLHDILAEACELVDNGVRELIITAQDTSAYGRDLADHPSLPELLQKLAAIPDLHWIRLLYTYPEESTDGLFRVIAAEEKICAYIDVPIQHIDDDILAAMNRRGDSKMIRERLEQARCLIPGVALRTSLIVGFPGETYKKFKTLLSFVEEMRFDHLGVFTYSPEEDTPAVSLPGHVGERTKKKRRGMIMEAQALISLDINRTLISSVQEVLVEGKSDLEDYPYLGRCRRQGPDIDGITYLRGRNLREGDFVMARIVAADEYDLFAVAEDM